MPPLVILYGSQTGAAKGIAELIHSESISRGYSATLSPSNAFEDAGLLTARVAIVVMSTTGDGDAPSNAEDFIRFLRRRTQPKDLFSSLQTAVLGLGDTNYSQFCAASKSVAKRFGELGARHFLPPVYADEAMGLQTTVDPWLMSLWGALDGLLSNEPQPLVAASVADIPAPSESKPAPIPAAVEAVVRDVAPVPQIVVPPAPSSPPSAASPAPPPAESSGTSEGSPVAMPISPMAMMAKMREINAAKTRKREADAAVSAAIAASLKAASSTVGQPEAEAAATGPLSPGHEQADYLEAAAQGAANDEGRRQSASHHQGQTSELAPTFAGGAVQAASAASREPGIIEVAAQQAAQEIPGPSSSQIAKSSSPPLPIRVPVSPSASSSATHARRPQAAYAGPVSFKSSRDDPAAALAGTVSPGVSTLFELYPSLVFGSEDREGVIPPAALSSAGKFFPKSPVPTLSCAPAAIDSEAETVAALSELSAQSADLSDDVNGDAECSVFSSSTTTMRRASSSLRSRTPSPGPAASSSGSRTPARSQTLAAQAARGVDAPVTIAISSCEYLSSQRRSGDRRILSLRLDVSNTTLAGSWSPGDALGIIAPNPIDVVNAVLASVGIDGDTRLSLRSVSAAGAGLVPSKLDALTPSATPSVAGVGVADATALSRPPLPPSISMAQTMESAEMRRPPALVPSWLPGYPFPTARDVLSWCVDLSAVPKKALLRALGDAAADQHDQDALFYLAGRSVGAVKAFANFVEAQRLDLRDLLSLFPSSKPQLATLLSVLSPMQPRFYSLASSPLVDPCTMRVAFNVVSYEARPVGAARGPLRYGLATTWLEAVATTAQEATAAAIANGIAPPPCPLLRAFLRPAKAFVPPPALSTPLVMVGPGTGISPFIGFIEHRAARRDAAVRAAAAATTGLWRGGAVLSGLSDVSDTTSNPGTVLGEAILIYGNRAPTVDWLFRSEVESAVASGALREAVAAWSRASDTPRELVTDVVGGKAAHAETQKALAALILRDKGHFFVCGGSAMAADVRTTLTHTLAQYSAMFNAGIDSPSLAEAYVAEMLKSGRYAEDKWG